MHRSNWAALIRRACRSSDGGGRGRRPESWRGRKRMTTRVNVGVRDKGKDGIGEEAVYWARNYYLLWVA